MANTGGIPCVLDLQERGLERAVIPGALYLGEITIVSSIFVFYVVTVKSF